MLLVVNEKIGAKRSVGTHSLTGVLVTIGQSFMFEAFGREDVARAKNAMFVACLLCAIVVVCNVKLRLPIICIGTNILPGNLSAHQL